MTIRKVSILGAGHGGFAAAADLALRGYTVSLHARNPERLAAIRDRGGIDVFGVVNGFARPELLTADLSQAVHDTDLIMLVVPSVAHEFYAHALAGELTGNVPVFLNPGHTGGGLHFLAELRRAGFQRSLQVCETISLTYIARQTSPSTVRVWDYVRNLGFSALPASDTAALAGQIRPLFPQIRPMQNAIAAALSNLNAIFHPPGMIMNAGWIERTAGGFKFYAEGITEAIGRVTQAVDRERLAIAQAYGLSLPAFIDEFYNVGLTTAAARDSRNVSIACEHSEANKLIPAPSSLDHRYLHEDVGFGLVAFSEFARIAGVSTPTTDALIQLASLSNAIDYRVQGLTLERLGLAAKSPAEILRFVDQGA